jgi:hypothetical protein
MKATTRVLAAALLAAGATTAVAGAATGALPEAHTQGKTTYVTGGIGEKEANAMKHAAGQYPLALQFVQKAKPRDEYLAGVKVTVWNARKDKVLDVTSEGPYLLAKLPAGTYTIAADHRGKVERRTVTVEPKTPHTVVFEWAG